MPELDAGVGEQWHQDFQGVMHRYRETEGKVDEEFDSQQEIYTKVDMRPVVLLTKPKIAKIWIMYFLAVFMLSFYASYLSSNVIW